MVYQKRFLLTIWQASNPDPLQRKSINSWIDYEEIIPWGILLKMANSLQDIVSINMIHDA